jgi:hypothetical protein
MNDLEETLAREQMSRLMREATRVAVPVDELVAEGHRRGTIKRRRRRTARQATAVAGATAVVVGVFALASPLMQSTATPSEGASVASEPSTADVGNDPRVSKLGVATRQMATTLATFLPRSGTASEMRTWASHTSPSTTVHIAGSDVELANLDPGAASAFRAGSLVYDDGTGAAQIAAIISEPDAGNPGGEADDAKALCSQDATCTTVAAGLVVALEGVPETGRGGPEGVVSTSVTVITTDGYTVGVTAYNAPAEKGVAPSRSEPMLTAEQLTAIATDPVWLS